MKGFAYVIPVLDIIANPRTNQVCNYGFDPRHSNALRARCNILLEECWWQCTWKTFLRDVVPHAALGSPGNILKITRILVEIRAWEVRHVAILLLPNKGI